VVLDQVREDADDGVGLEAMDTGLLLGILLAQVVEEAEESEEQNEERRGGQRDFHGDLALGCE